MRKSIRHIACDILTQVSQSQAFAGELLDECLNEQNLSGTADGRLLTHLVYGVLRMQGHLDWILAKLYRGDFPKMDDGVKNVLRTGLYQIKFSDRLPAFAVVDEAVKVAKKINPAASGLVNAILRGYLRNTEKLPFPSLEKNLAEHLAAFYSHPLWLVKIWLTILGKDETLALCKANNEMPPLTIRTNTIKISNVDLQSELANIGFSVHPTRNSPDGLILTDSTKPVQKTGLFRDGLLRIQDEAAQLISHLINPQAGDCVLDACAGSGGKTTHLAALLQNKGELLAIDRSAEKLAELNKDAARMGISIIQTKSLDLVNELPDDLKEHFDLVLVDAPCSGTGTLRRNPEIKWRTKAEDLPIFAKTQKLILANAAQAVKKGGNLLYCTCSLQPQENEEVIEYFLSHHADFSLSAPPSTLNEKLFDTRGFFHTYPHRHGMDGFFGAILKRRSRV